MNCTMHNPNAHSLYLVMYEPHLTWVNGADRRRFWPGHESKAPNNTEALSSNQNILTYSPLAYLDIPRSKFESKADQLKLLQLPHSLHLHLQELDSRTAS